jgi:hypothetical protein
MANVRPVVRLDGENWQRVKRVDVHERPLGGHSLAFTTPARCRRVQTAFCYPYGPDDLKTTLKATKAFWEVAMIGLTGKGRELLRLHVQADKKRPGRPGVYIVARQHAGEVPGSWVLDGILRAVASEEPGRRLRGVEWWIVPFVDLDGAVEGNYGKDCFPIDFNRSWAEMPMRPEVGAIQQDMQYFADGRRRRLILDLHGPGGGETRMYLMHPRKDAPKAQREAAQGLQQCLCAQIPEQPPERLGVVPEYGIRWDWRHNLSSWAWDALSKTLGVTIETAYQPMNDGQWSDRGDYREIGRRIANAAAVWVTGKRKARR